MKDLVFETINTTQATTLHLESTPHNKHGWQGMNRIRKASDSASHSLLAVTRSDQLSLARQKATRSYK